MKRFYILTYGCQMNKSDSERIATLLEKKGCKPAENESEADLIIVNVCSVRQKPVDKAFQKILNLKSKILNLHLKSKILLTGCVLEADKKNFEKLGVEIKQFKNLEKTKPKTGFVLIMQGCNNFCTYCVVPYTRGRERCRPPQEIICEVKHLIKRGIKEITLLGQNVNSYRYNVKCQNPNVKSNPKSKCQISNVFDFADLLQEINNISGDFKIKFLTNHPKDMTDKLIETIARYEKIAKYIHLPVQAGDNEILRKMNRGYTKEQYLDLVKKIRQKIPDVELTTDVIVGFPGETKQAFGRTVDLFKKCRFSNAFIGKFAPRPGTAAYYLKDNVPAEEKKRRERVLTNLL